MKTMGLLTQRKLFTPQRGMVTANTGGLPPYNYVSFSEDPSKFVLIRGGTGSGIANIFADGVGVASTTRQLLPDIPGGGAGLGFTCTGLTLDPSGDFWVGNFGQQRGDGTGASPPISAVRVSPDGSTYRTQVLLTEATVGLQGISYMTTQGWIAYVDGANPRICFVTPAGAIPRAALNLSFIPNALFWDNANQVFWVGDATNGNVWRLDLLGVASGFADFNGWGNSLDHIHVDGNTMWTTSGGNGSPGRLIAWDIARDRFINSWLLNDAQAVEGIYVNGATLIVVSDGYYHSSGSAPNTVAPYNVNDFQTYATPALVDRRHNRIWKAGQLIGPYGRQPYHILLDRGDSDTSNDFAIFARNGDVAVNGLSANMAWSGKSAIVGTPANLGMRLLNGVMANRVWGDTYSRQIFAATYANGANDMQLGTRGTQTPDRIVDVIGSALALNKGAAAVAYRARLGA